MKILNGRLLIRENFIKHDLSVLKRKIYELFIANEVNPTHIDVKYDNAFYSFESDDYYKKVCITLKNFEIITLISTQKMPQLIYRNDRLEFIYVFECVKFRETNIPGFDKTVEELIIKGLGFNARHEERQQI